MSKEFTVNDPIVSPGAMTVRSVCSETPAARARRQRWGLLFGSSAAALLGTLATSASAVELLTNGGFESGLTDWTSVASNGAGTSCDTHWVHGAEGYATQCLGVADPIDAGAAYSAFDGNGPQTFSLSQSIVVPAGVGAASLSWRDSFASSYSGSPRVFSIRIIGSTTQTVHTYNLPNNLSATPFTLHTIDITSALDAVAGETVQLEFLLTIPGNFTGPAGAGLDTVSLDVTPSDAVAPTLTISGPVAAQTGPFTVNFDFDESVTGFTESDIAPTNATISAFSGSGASYSATITPLADGPVSLNVAASAYQDAAANLNTLPSTYSVAADLTAPVITTPGTITVGADPGQITAIVTYAVTATDAGHGAIVPVLVSGPASGSAFPIGTTAITYSATDAAGNVSTASFNVVVADQEVPAIVGLPGNIAINVDYPTTSAVATWTEPTATDNAAGSTITRIAGPAPGSTFPLGVTTITYRAQDSTGNIVDQSFTVTVSQTPPGSVRIVIQSGEDGAFGFTSPEPDLNVTVNTVNGEGSVTVPIRPGVFNLAFAFPAGFGILNAECDDANSTLDGDARVGAVDVSAGELVTCTITAADSRTETSRIVGAFMGARAALIMQNMPDADRRIDRLNARASQPTGVSAFGLNVGRGDVPFELALGRDQADFSFSLAGMRAQRANNRGADRAARARWGNGEFEDGAIARPRDVGFGDGGLDAGDVGVLAAYPGAGTVATSTSAGYEVLRADAAGDIADVGEHRFDLWMEGSYAQFDTKFGDGDFYMLSVGADWITNPNLLLGFGVQIDWTDMTGPLAGSSITGTGFLAGPYVTARLRDGLYFDGQLSVGQSFNQVSPFGAYEDDVNAERAYASAALIGDMHEGAWTFRPEGRFSYFREETDAYVDSLSVAIPSLAVETGTLSFSPTVSYRHVLANQSTVEPFVSLQSIWTFTQKNTAAFALGNDSYIGEGLRGRVEAGFSFVQAGGMNINATGFYDGIGEEDFSSWGAQIRFAWSFDPE